jgi:hypothetical protein
MKINMQAALSSEDIIEAIADFVSEKTGSTVDIDAVELGSNEYGIWAKVTVEADSDALTKSPKKKTSAKRTAPKLTSVKTEETPEAVEEEVNEKMEAPEVSDTPQESDTTVETEAHAGPTAEETLSDLKAAAAGKGNIFNRKTS